MSETRYVHPPWVHLNLNESMQCNAMQKLLYKSAWNGSCDCLFFSTVTYIRMKRHLKWEGGSWFCPSTIDWIVGSWGIANKMEADLNVSLQIVVKYCAEGASAFRCCLSQRLPLTSLAPPIYRDLKSRGVVLRGEGRLTFWLKITRAH